MEIPKLDVEYAARFCFACSQRNPIGLKLKPVQDGEKVTAEFTAGKFHQGWDNVIHGGILYTLLDEVTAYAMLCRGIELGVTAKSEIRFKQLAPINQPIRASAWVTKLTKRLVEAKGEISLEDNTVIADGSFLFYVLRQSKKVVLWDMDAVISHSYSLHFAAWREIFAKRSIELTKRDFTELFGARDDLLVGSIMGRELPGKDVQSMVQEKEEAFRRKAKGRIKPFPGVVRLLNTLRKGNFRLGLVSPAPREDIELTVSELELAGTFNCVVSGQEVSEGKPSPQIYLLAAEKLQATANDCVVVEDSRLGVKAAKAAGMKCLAVASSHRRENLREADAVVDSLENVDLITLLMRL
jgi:beta-phosphoglucomutase